MDRVLVEKRAAAAVPVDAARAGVPRLVAWAVLAGAGLTVLAVIAMVLRRLPTGSREAGWTYPYDRLAGEWHVLWPALVVTPAVLGLLWLSRRLPERADAAVAAGWFVAVIPLQLLLRTYALPSLGDIVASDRANSFYSPSQRWGIGEFMGNYMGLVEQLPPHARTNMPGKTMLYFLLDALGLGPAAMGVAVLALANLSAVLLWLIVRDLTSDRRIALYALVLGLLLPGTLYFAPVLNAVSPVPILLALWLHVRFLKTGRYGYALGLGCALYLTVFFEALPLVLGVVFAALLGVALRQRTLTWPDVLRLVALTVAGFAVCNALLRGLFGYDLFDNFAYVLADANDFNARWRPYGMWVTRNLWYLALAAGVASCVLLAAATFDAVRRRSIHPAAVLTLSGVAVLVVLDLWGINRGETVRLWIFLAVYLQIAAAWLCARTPRLWPAALLLSAAILQSTAGSAMIGFVRV
ncbi:hypothetical protein Cme02nite_65980 [Catellatospora methionotrophica]|uniref:Glycosyltransferase RgtA/B/C/D-like domain-containing protein n=1 Tax=Catellatospora methionotrophica TaxID=121620 RepID=A0A8J3PKA3_9ACTN|nr:hypothetical protein [Catellatospora methionotrophica]GIG18266.1 hypothetical protein Cme02nite_65980 [Catellatospora methionotrophica]